jgi:Raf kinase inhibitor-like YbhB/YbcL family protein
MIVLVAAVLVTGCSEGSTERPVHTTTDATTEAETDMRLTSSAFTHETPIPTRYTCDGADVSPPLQLSELPTDIVSLALVMDDPDAPAGVWDHWVEYDIEPREAIPEAVTDVGTAGKNSWDRTGYGGPCPPRGTHRYFFTVYALDTKLGLDSGADKAAVLAAIEGHILDQATLMGTYSRQ